MLEDMLSNRFPGDVKGAGPGTTLGFPSLTKYRYQLSERGEPHEISLMEVWEFMFSTSLKSPPPPPPGEYDALQGQGTAPM